MTDTYRLTFNKPAVAQMLQTDSGETADGLKIRIENGTAQFMPVCNSKDGDVVPLEERSRGGVEANIEGTMAEDLAKALDNDAGPFHTLVRAGHGWLGVQRHETPEAPSKFVPHVRVWHTGSTRPTTKYPKVKIPKTSMRTVTRNTADHDEPITGESVLRMFDYLRTARETLNGYSSIKRRGQPPRDVRNAREVITAFNHEAVDFLALGDGRSRKISDRIAQ